MKKVAGSVGTALFGILFGGGMIGSIAVKEMKKVKKMSDKHLALFLMMNQWVKVKQDGKNLASYFEKNNYKKIAIYGMSYAGETLVNELKDSQVEVKYGIDKNPACIYSDMEIYTLDNYLKEVDVVVVTPIFFFQEIKEQLSRVLDCPIISLEDILYEV